MTVDISLLDEEEVGDYPVEAYRIIKDKEGQKLKVSRQRRRVLEEGRYLESVLLGTQDLFAVRNNVFVKVGVAMVMDVDGTLIVEIIDEQ